MLRRHRAIFFAAAAMLALGAFGRQHSAGGDAKATPNVDRHGDALPDGAVTRMGTTRWRHGDAITFLAFPSDDTVLTAAPDNTARLWERKTGKEIRRFEVGGTQQPQIGQPGAMMMAVPFGRGAGSRVAITPDGKIFAAAVANNTIQLWDVGTGKALRELKGPATGISGLLFSPNGKALAITGNERTIHLIKTENGDEIRQIKAMLQKGPVRFILGGGFAESNGLDFSPDGKILASAEIEFGQQ